MKILYKNRSFGGGAPRSLLEYAKIAQKNNHSVVAVGEYTHSPDYYNTYGIRTYNIPFFKIKNPIGNLYSFYKYFRVIKREKPDLIHVITTGECLFQRSISTLLNIPTVYTVPGGEVNHVFAQVMKNEDLIVFSHENKEDLVGFGYDSDKITVNSNRMCFSANSDCNNKLYENRINSPINLLFIGRIDSNYNSIIKVIELIKFLVEKDFEIELRVIGDGKKIEELRVKGNQINSLFNKKIIIFEGFCKNVYEYIDKAHIVFGKGRSIIDAISNLRVSFVSAESGHFFHANPENIHWLSRYNFTGRKANNSSSFEDVIKYVERVAKMEIDIENLYKTKVITQELYDIEYAEEKIINIYKNTLNNFKSINKFSRVTISIGIIVRLYYKYLIAVLKRKLINTYRMINLNKSTRV